MSINFVYISYNNIVTYFNPSWTIYFLCNDVREGYEKNGQKIFLLSVHGLKETTANRDWEVAHYILHLEYDQ